MLLVDQYFIVYVLKYVLYISILCLLSVLFINHYSRYFVQTVSCLNSSWLLKIS